MRNILLLLILLSFTIGCVPKRIGKIKHINKLGFNLTDSIYILSPFFSYEIFGNSFTGSAWDLPTSEQMSFEKSWDSIQMKIANKKFNGTNISYRHTNQNYKARLFDFKILLTGEPEYIKSDTTSFLLSKFTWNIRDNKIDKAFQYLPDSLLQISHSRPLMVITNYFRFYEIEFQAYYASGTTGMNFIPDCLVAILYKGEIQYFRGFRKRYKLEKVLSDPSIIERITLKLFDRIK